MWELTVADVGSNRKRAILAVRDLLGMTLTEAQARIDRPSVPLASGDANSLRPIKSGLEAAGVEVSTHLNVTDEEAADWAYDHLAPDKRHCKHCGREVFYMIPGKTTADAVQSFLEESGRTLEIVLKNDPSGPPDGSKSRALVTA